MNLFTSSRLCILACLAFASVAWGQTPSGQIHLEVKDSSGAAASASGTLTQLPSGQNRRYQTDNIGNFTFENLPYGRYRLEVSKPGFATQAILLDVTST